MYKRQENGKIKEKEKRKEKGKEKKKKKEKGKGKGRGRWKEDSLRKDERTDAHTHGATNKHSK